MADLASLYATDREREQERAAERALEKAQEEAQQARIHALEKEVTSTTLI